MNSRYVHWIAIVMAAGLTLALLSGSTLGMAWFWARLGALSNAESNVTQVVLPLGTAFVLAVGAALRMRRSRRQTSHADRLTSA